MKKTKRLVYEHMPFVIAIVASFIYYFFGPIISTHNNFPDVLQAIITFASIVIAFYGVILTSVITMKMNMNSDKASQQTLFANYFKRVDNKGFTKAIKYSLLSGFILVAVSVLLFFLNGTAVYAKIPVSFWLFLLVYFSALTYRIMATMIELLLSGDMIVTDQPLDAEKAEKLRNHYKRDK